MVTPGQQRLLWWRGRRSRRRRRRRRRRPLWRRRGGGRGGRLGTSSPSVVSWQWPARQVSASLISSNPFTARLTRPTPSTYLPSSDVGHDSLVLSSHPTESNIRRKSPDQSQVRSPIGISPPSDYQAIDNKTARLRRLSWLNSFKMTQNFRI